MSNFSVLGFLMVSVLLLSACGEKEEETVPEAASSPEWPAVVQSAEVMAYRALSAEEVNQLLEMESGTSVLMLLTDDRNLELHAESVSEFVPGVRSYSGNLMPPHIGDWSASTADSMLVLSIHLRGENRKFETRVDKSSKTSYLVEVDVTKMDVKPGTSLESP